MFLTGWFTSGKLKWGLSLYWKGCEAASKTRSPVYTCLPAWGVKMCSTKVFLWSRKKYPVYIWPRETSFVEMNVKSMDTCNCVRYLQNILFVSTRFWWDLLRCYRDVLCRYVIIAPYSNTNALIHHTFV